jgi:hypothetical protein
VPYVEDTTINDDILLWKPIKRRVTAKELFRIVDFVKEKTQNSLTVLEYARLQLM